MMLIDIAESEMHIKNQAKFKKALSAKRAVTRRLELKRA
jgi:hypothetical protein